MDKKTADKSRIIQSKAIIEMNRLYFNTIKHQPLIKKFKIDDHFNFVTELMEEFFKRTEKEYLPYLDEYRKILAIVKHGLRIWVTYMEIHRIVLSILMYYEVDIRVEMTHMFLREENTEYLIRTLQKKSIVASINTFK